MNIAVDIDDTLTDSFDYFQPFVAEYFGAPLCELRAKKISYSNLPLEWKKEEAAFGRAYYDRFAADTPFKADAAWGVRALRAHGHRVVILTGRTDAFYTDPYRTTRQELANGGIVYDGLICTLDKADACLRENISVLIDDLPQNCAAAARQGIFPVLFGSAANRDAAVPYERVSDWAGAVAAVLAFAARRPSPEHQGERGSFA